MGPSNEEADRRLEGIRIAMRLISIAEDSGTFREVGCGDMEWVITNHAYIATLRRSDDVWEHMQVSAKRSDGEHVLVFAMYHCEEGDWNPVVEDIADADAFWAHREEGDTDWLTTLWRSVKEPEVWYRADEPDPSRDVRVQDVVADLAALVKLVGKMERLQPGWLERWEIRDREFQVWVAGDDDFRNMRVYRLDRQGLHLPLISAVSAGPDTSFSVDCKAEYDLPKGFWYDDGDWLAALERSARHEQGWFSVRVFDKATTGENPSPDSNLPI